MHRGRDLRLLHLPETIRDVNGEDRRAHRGPDQPDSGAHVPMSGRSPDVAPDDAISSRRASAWPEDVGGTRLTWGAARHIGPPSRALLRGSSVVQSLPVPSDGSHPPLDCPSPRVQVRDPAVLRGHAVSARGGQGRCKGRLRRLRTNCSPFLGFCDRMTRFTTAAVALSS